MSKILESLGLLLAAAALVIAVFGIDGALNTGNQVGRASACHWERNL
jgi:hypothetical protein